MKRANPAGSAGRRRTSWSCSGSARAVNHRPVPAPVLEGRHVVRVASSKSGILATPQRGPALLVRIVDRRPRPRADLGDRVDGCLAVAPRFPRSVRMQVSLRRRRRTVCPLAGGRGRRPRMALNRPHTMALLRRRRPSRCRQLLTTVFRNGNSRLPSRDPPSVASTRVTRQVSPAGMTRPRRRTGSPVRP